MSYDKVDEDKNYIIKWVEAEKSAKLMGTLHSAS